MNKFVKVLFNILVCFIFTILLYDLAQVLSDYNKEFQSINNDAGIDIKQNKIVGSNWEITLPENWTTKPVDSSKEDVILTSFSKDSNVLLFNKSHYYSTKDQLSIDAIRYVKTNGLKVQSSTSIKLNELDIIRIDSYRDNINEITIATLKDGYKYFLSCTYIVSKDDCEKIMNSLIIN
jgi:hypothetical protein